MKIKKTLLLIGCALIFSSCSSNKLTHSYIYLNLPANATTGYQWACEIENENVVALKSTEYVAGESEDMVGIPGYQKYVFEIYSQGESNITFTYSRSWEDEVLYSLAYLVKVDKNLKATQEFKTGIYDDNEVPDLKFERISE